MKIQKVDARRLSERSRRDAALMYVPGLKLK
jgi:hypothetical protein